MFRRDLGITSDVLHHPPPLAILLFDVVDYLPAIHNEMKAGNISEVKLRQVQTVDGRLDLRFARSTAFFLECAVVLKPGVIAYDPYCPATDVSVCAKAGIAHNSTQLVRHLYLSTQNNFGNFSRPTRI